MPTIVTSHARQRKTAPAARIRPSSPSDLSLIVGGGYPADLAMVPACVRPKALPVPWTSARTMGRPAASPRWMGGEPRTLTFLLLLAALAAAGIDQQASLLTIPTA